MQGVRRGFPRRHSHLQGEKREKTHTKTFLHVMGQISKLLASFLHLMLLLPPIFTYCIYSVPLLRKFYMLGTEKASSLRKCALRFECINSDNENRHWEKVGTVYGHSFINKPLHPRCEAHASCLQWCQHVKLSPKIIVLHTSEI